MLRLVAVLAVVGFAVWLWWQPEPDRHRSSRTAGTEDEAPERTEPPAESDDGAPLVFDDILPEPVLSGVEVVDPQGKPVPGALVVAYDYDLDSGRDVRLAARETGADGRALFDDLEASSVTVRKPGFALTRAEADEETVRVTLQPALAVTGRAVVAGGAPAAGTTIRIWDADEPYDHDIDLPQVTDHDGRFTLTGIRENHPFIVVATHRSYAPVVAELATPRELLLTFGNGLTLTGDVLDEDGEPAAAEVVVAWANAVSPFERSDIRLGNEERELAAMPRPDCDDGRFTVRGLQPDAYVVYARGPAGHGQARVRLDADGHVVVRVVRPATLVVAVTGPNGEGVENYVAVHHDGDWEHYAGEPMQLAAERYVVTANGRGFVGVSEEIRLRPGEARTLALRLREGVLVLGRVVGADGAPIAGAQVRVRQVILGDFDWAPSVKTDANGAWTLRGLAAGARTLQVAADGYYDHDEEVDVAPDARYEVSLEPRGRIVGRFSPPPAGRLSVDLDYDGGSSSLSILPGPDDSFVIWDPDVGGRVTVTIRPKGGAPVVLRNFEFPRGGVHDLGVIEVVPPAPLRLTVLDQAGRPASAALVEIHAPDYRTGLRTDAIGYLEVADQAPEVFLRIVADGHAATYRTVGTTQPVTVRLARGAAVSGRVVDPAGEPAARAYVVFCAKLADGSPDLWRSWQPEVDGEGRFALLLPEGAYRVRVYGERRQLLPETFEAKDGASFELRLR